MLILKLIKKNTGNYASDELSIELISLEDQALVYQAVNKSQVLVNNERRDVPNVDELPIDKEVLRSIYLCMMPFIIHENQLLKVAAAKAR